MSTTATIEFLKEQQEQIRSKAERDMAALGEAIITLEEVQRRIDAGVKPKKAPATEKPPAPPAPAKPAGPTVTAMALAAAKVIGAGGAVFDAVKIRDRILADNPGCDVEKVKRGIHVSAGFLIEKGHFKRVPGGLQFQNQP